MDVQTRIAVCLLIEKMNQQAEYCKKIGLINQSDFREYSQIRGILP